MLLLTLLSSASTPLSDYLDGATANVVLSCAAARNYTLADTPALAMAPPPCGWRDYEAFLTEEGLEWTDVPMQLHVDVTATATELDSPVHAELTFIQTTALTIADALRLTLGNEAYRSRTEPVTIDVVGWAFHWLDRSDVTDTSMTAEAPDWPDVEQATRLFWGVQIGDALRRMLPLVESVAVRGYGPEAPRLPPTALRDDGWLTLELVPGLYETPSEPAPTLTLLENSGLHDDYWPSDGGCVSDKGRHLSEAELRRRASSGELDGVGLGCLWRKTVELLVRAARPVWATSYTSHEHLGALENLRAAGARVGHAYNNGFGEASARAPTLDLLEPPGPIAAALRDPWPRPWGAKEEQYATTAALWRYRVEVGGYERRVRARRNSHVVGFAGAVRESGADAAPALGEGASSANEQYRKLWRQANSAQRVQKGLQAQVCGACALASMPPRHAEVAAATWRCKNPARLELATLGAYPTGPPPPPPPEVDEKLRRGVELSAVEGEEGAAEEAFRAAAAAGPHDARPPLNLGRYLAKLNRPAEAIEAFYAAAGIDAEYFLQAKLGVGTARAQQGRLREAIADFEAASAIEPSDEKLRASLGPMRARADAIEAATEGVEDGAADVCGTPCRDVVDGSGIAVCAVTWAQGCGDVPAPDGFTAESTVAELCRRACAVFVAQQQGGA